MLLRKTEKPIEPTTFLDVRSLPGGKDVLSRVDDRAVRLISKEAVRLLGEHPTARKGHDTARLAHLLWASVRSARYDDEHNVEDALARAMMSPIHDLGRVLDVLLEAGDVRRTLLLQREAIEAQLKVLERFGGGDAA